MKPCETCGVMLDADGNCHACRAREIQAELQRTRHRLAELTEELAALNEQVAESQRVAS